MAAIKPFGSSSSADFEAPAICGCFTEQMAIGRPAACSDYVSFDILFANSAIGRGRTPSPKARRWGIAAAAELPGAAASLTEREIV